MQLVDLSKPGEKKKLVWAAVLGLVAIIFLWWVLIGFDSGTRTSNARPVPSPAPQKTAPNAVPTNGTASSPNLASLTAFTEEVKYTPSSYSAPEANRNIFAYYEPPPKVVPTVATPSTTPTPTPPVLLASLSPSNVYARTADFKLELAGDKFTSDLRVYVDGRELPTAYRNPQQVSATVAAAVIANPGTRQVVVRTADNRLYSNPLTINVAAPPLPNYSYVGIIGTRNRVDDVALVQDRNNKSIINVRRGDILSGRFRVTSISEKELVLTDTSLKIKHLVAMTEADKGSGPLSRPTPKVDAEDDDP